MGFKEGDKIITEPLNNFSVANALGTTNTNISKLCCSPLINPKSANKPIRYLYATDSVDDKTMLSYDITIKDLSSIAKRKANYGIDIKQYDTIDGKLNVSKMMQEVLNSLNYGLNNDETPKAFIYDKPNSGDRVRLTDFIGYAIEPSDWVSVSFPKYGSNDITTAIRLTYSEGLTRLADLQYWGVFNALWNQQNISNVYFCFIVGEYDVTTNKGFTNNVVVPILNGEDILQQDESLIDIDCTNIPQGYTYPVMLFNPTPLSCGNAYESTAFTNTTIIPIPFASITEWKFESNSGGTGGDEGDTTNLLDTISVDILNLVYTIPDVGYYELEELGLCIYSSHNESFNISTKVMLADDVTIKRELLSQDLMINPESESFLTFEAKEDSDFIRFSAEEPTIIVELFYGLESRTRYFRLNEIENKVLSID